MTRGPTVVLTTLGSIGDLLPFLAIGKALRRRGREVIIATHDEYEWACRLHGLEFRGIWDGRRSEGAFRHLLAGKPSEIWNDVWREFFVPAVRPTFEAVEQLIASRRCIVVAPWSVLGAAMACEKHGTGFCSVYLSPYALRFRGGGGDAIQEGGADQAVDEVRRDCGLPPRRSGDGAAPQPMFELGLFPEWFASPDRAAAVTATGFPLYDDALLPVPTAKLRRFLDQGEPPIVFTPGSFMDRANEFFSEALSACDALGQRAVFLTPHHHQIPAALPKSVLHLEYAPLHSLLPRARALFHHGGIGTCAQAMRAGVPQVISPIFFDQFDNAERVERLGVGFAFSAWRDPSSIADAVAKVVARDRGGASRASVQELFRRDAAEDVCDRLEEFVH